MKCKHQDTVYRGTDRMNKLEFHGSAIKNFTAERVKYRCLKCGEHFTEIRKGRSSKPIFPDDEKVKMKNTEL